jgi:dihydroorotase
VTSFDRALPALKAMAELGVPLLVHGEVTDDHVDMFDREAVFIRTKLVRLGGGGVGLGESWRFCE